MKPAAIQLSGAAASDIAELAQWYADRSDDILSKKWERAVTAALLRIVDFPKSGALCRFRASELRAVRRMTIAGFPKHLVFYQLEGDSVFILRIVHGARDPRETTLTVSSSSIEASLSTLTQGYSVLPPLFSNAELSVVADALSSLPRTRAGIRHVLRHRAVADLANDSRLLSLAKNILGPHAFPFHATLFDKSPDANWLVVWHQDTALPLKEKHDASGWGPWSIKDGVTYAHAPAAALEQVLAIRVHLDDSTADNGPLRVLPGTHTSGVLTDDEIRTLSTEIPPVECVVNKGGIILMRPLTIHASSKSIGEAGRRVLHIEYAATVAFGTIQLAFDR